MPETRMGWGQQWKSPSSPPTLPHSCPFLLRSFSGCRVALNLLPSSEGFPAEMPPLCNCSFFTFGDTMLKQFLILSVFAISFLNKTCCLIKMSGRINPSVFKKSQSADRVCLLLAWRAERQPDGQGVLPATQAVSLPRLMQLQKRHEDITLFSST